MENAVPTKISLPELPTLIQKLLEERQHHTDALARIDEVLASIGAVLGGTTVAMANGKALDAPSSKAPAGPTTKRRKGSRFAVSGEASIFSFVSENKNPTTQEIKKHWAGEGRASSADNTLSIMVKHKKLKRTPLGKGIRGSQYSLP
jgi:hypothetical protein